jgi:hypothetical protein
MPPISTEMSAIADLRQSSVSEVTAASDITKRPPAIAPKRPAITKAVSS